MSLAIFISGGDGSVGEYGNVNILAVKIEMALS
jgi:hypothetical protein